MQIELNIIITANKTDPELVDKILGRIYTLDAVTDVKLANIKPAEKPTTKED